MWANYNWFFFLIIVINSDIVEARGRSQNNKIPPYLPERKFRFLSRNEDFATAFLFQGGDEFVKQFN